MTPSLTAHIQTCINNCEEKLRGNLTKADREQYEIQIGLHREEMDKRKDLFSEIRKK